MKANKAKQDWKFIGSFVGALVVLFTIISGVFKKAGIGFEIIEWLNDEGKEFFIGKLGEITDKFVWRGPRITADDDIIHVDRSVAPAYPKGILGAKYSDLDSMGPSEYSIRQVEKWTPGDQSGIDTTEVVDRAFNHVSKDAKIPKIVNGEVILRHMEDLGIFRTFFGLSDLLAIKGKGITFFRKYFDCASIYGLRGVVEIERGRLLIPHLRESNNEVILEWESLDNGYFSDTIFPRFKQTANIKVEPV